MYVGRGLIGRRQRTNRDGRLVAAETTVRLSHSHGLGFRMAVFALSSTPIDITPLKADPLLFVCRSLTGLLASGSYFERRPDIIRPRLKGFVAQVKG